jgi:uncharacterized membrane protein (UPF0127 family)
MKKILIPALVVFSLFLIWFYTKHPLTTQVKIRGQKFNVEIAVTAKEKEKGLGYRDSLPKMSGMLFPYDHEEQYKFWMKGMRFPIDIIWIRDQTIMDITKNVPVPTGGVLPQYGPAVNVNKILELNAGTVDEFGIQVGDLVLIDN